MTPPLVAQMSDDNGDGKVNQQDATDIVVLADRGYDGGFDPNLYVAAIRIFDGKSGSEVRTISTSPGVDGFTNLALADIDG